MRPALAAVLRAAKPRPELRSYVRIPACTNCLRFQSSLAADSEFTDDNVVMLAKVLADRRDALSEQGGRSGQDAIAIAKEVKELESIHRAWAQWKRREKELYTSMSLAESESDNEMKELALEEVATIRADLQRLRQRLESELVPSDPLDDSGAIMEFKPGVGGAESTLFLGQIVRMYMRYIQSHADKGWNVEMISSTAVEVSTSTAGGGDGLKEAILEVTGKGVYGHLRYEAGVHRVQRIPATQNLGKIQTSTIATVVLPLAEESAREKKDDVVDPKDVKIEVMRSRGAGGQHVNKTESAVRLTHEPTGITVSMQDSRSQQQNRTKAWAILRARLLDRQMREQVSSNRAVRQAQIAGMERSDRIRTYNFPQDRVTDHRVSQSLSGIDKFMEGADEDNLHLGHMIMLLREHADAKALQAALEKAKEDMMENGISNGGKGKGKRGK